MKFGKKTSAKQIVLEYQMKFERFQQIIHWLGKTDYFSLKPLNSSKTKQIPQRIRTTCKVGHKINENKEVKREGMIELFTLRSKGAKC